MIKTKHFSINKKILLLKRERLDGLIKLIDDILKGDNTMSFKEFSKEEIEEMFQAMLSNMNNEQLDSTLLKIRCCQVRIKTWQILSYNNYPC